MLNVDELRKTLRSLEMSDRKDNQRAVISVILGGILFHEGVKRIFWDIGDWQTSGLLLREAHYTEHFFYSIIYDTSLLGIIGGFYTLALLTVPLLLLVKETRVYGLILSCLLGFGVMLVGIPTVYMFNFGLLVFSLSAVLLYYEHRNDGFKKRVKFWYFRYKMDKIMFG